MTSDKLEISWYFCSKLESFLFQQLASDFDVTACPTFLFFRQRTLVRLNINVLNSYIFIDYLTSVNLQLGRRVTTRPNKLKKDVEKYSKVFIATPSLPKWMGNNYYTRLPLLKEFSLISTRYMNSSSPYYYCTS